MSDQWVPTYRAGLFTVWTPFAQERCYTSMWYQRTELEELDQPLVFCSPVSWISPEEVQRRRDNQRKAAARKQQLAWDKKVAAVRVDREKQRAVALKLATRPQHLPRVFVALDRWPKMPHTIYTQESGAARIVSRIRSMGMVRTGTGIWEAAIGRLRKVRFFNMNEHWHHQMLYRVTVELA